MCSHLKIPKGFLSKAENNYLKIKLVKVSILNLKLVKHAYCFNLVVLENGT